jgi:uncharacterized phiE125 gp8 family phage protein
MTSRVITPPVTEPVSVAEARAYLRLPTADEDGLLAILIRAARESCETYLGKAFATQTIRMTTTLAQGARSATLPLVPVASIVHVKNGEPLGGFALTTMDPTDYIISPESGTILLVRRFGSALEVEYVADGDCPALVKRAILLLVEATYEDRGAPAMTAAVAGVLQPLRRMSL